MKTVYEIMENKQRRRHSFEDGSEYSFFLENRYLLEKSPKFSFLYEKEDDYFSVMRANIIIKSIQNKIKIEKIISKHLKEESLDLDLLKKELNDCLENLPYFQINNKKIFIPFFTRSLNTTYIENPEKFLVSPFKELMGSFNDSMVDSFDLYGYNLFNSSFTRLVMVKENDLKDEAAFFHFDTNTIYFINNQGRLNDKLVLFDRYIKRPNTYHMIERIIPVIDAYFAFDRRKMIQSLHENDFISGRLMSILRKNDEDNYEI